MPTLLTFTHLRDLQKKERDSRKLEKLHPDFYTSVSEYVARKNGDASGSGANSELETAMPVIKYILERREQKIIESAILSVRSGIKPENILPAEEAFFNAVCGIISGRKAEVDAVLGLAVENRTAGEAIEKSAPPVVLDAAAPQEKEAVQAEAKITSEKSLGVSIKILKEVPAFIAEDLLAHGPWNAGETVECPPKAAAILVENGFAEYG